MTDKIFSGDQRPSSETPDAHWSPKLEVLEPPMYEPLALCYSCPVTPRSRSKWYWTRDSSAPADQYVIQTSFVPAFQLYSSNIVYLHCNLQLCLVGEDPDNCKLKTKVTWPSTCSVLWGPCGSVSQWACTPRTELKVSNRNGSIKVLVRKRQYLEKK